MDKVSYLVNPNFCPVCSSKELSCDDRYGEGNKLFLYVCCEDCSSRWTEEYILTDVWVTTDMSVPDDDPITETDVVSETD